MKSFATVLLALLGGVTAQTTTVIEVVNPFFGHNPFDASIVDVNPTATTYAVYCQRNSTNYQCRGDPSGSTMTLVGGPSTVEVHIEQPESGLSTQFIGTISGGQLDYEGVIMRNGRTAQIAHMVMSPVTNEDARVPLTVTAGVEKLLAQATATTESSGAQSGPTATGTQATLTSTPASTPNAAVSRAGQKRLLNGIAGTAAVAAVMML
ncbi:hypothetical protein CDEST_08538 [Colletotrichum destructivum]|uniref:Uncharacterized protein n=1 Tax=Colletotrichum destructivum TaxID=34406 RepID=A0AAX4IJH6_9PEZI|nr:hypothetical protein CDEST_08538 [Colletotrichum destructivum]